ncbi:Ornithine decarboxylase, constitutive [Serratia plymuthica]|uniref:Ornithine decarboxylase, constitutive n=1 Tax=Serratia plymuthica TaxID=82996 RepID=A0A2X4UZ94_SERPL|nr:Ornithine decarboxylase, constitutive [Serratia plymuthica]
MHAGAAGRRMWMDCVKLGIETRKQLLERCSQLRPFIPLQVAGKAWQDYDTDLIANDARFFNFVPARHGTVSKAMRRTNIWSIRASCC